MLQLDSDTSIVGHLSKLFTPDPENTRTVPRRGQVVLGRDDGVFLVLPRRWNGSLPVVGQIGKRGPSPLHGLDNHP